VTDKKGIVLKVKDDLITTCYEQKIIFLKKKPKKIPQNKQTINKQPNKQSTKQMQNS